MVVTRPINKSIDPLHVDRTFTPLNSEHIYIYICVCVCMYVYCIFSFPFLLVTLLFQPRFSKSERLARIFIRELNITTVKF